MREGDILFEDILNAIPVSNPVQPTFTELLTEGIEPKSEITPKPLEPVNRIYSKATGFYTVEEFYARLDALGYDYSQTKAFIESGDFSLLVACAGSGKTTVIILSLIYGYITGRNYKDTGLPKSILVSTFLRTGAEELKKEFKEWAEKLNLNLFNELRNISFATLHSEFVQALKLAVSLNVIPRKSFGGLLGANDQALLLNKLVLNAAESLGIRSSLFKDFKKMQKKELETLSSFYSFLTNRIQIDDFVLSHSAVHEFNLTQKSVIEFKQKVDTAKETLYHKTGNVMDFDTLLTTLYRHLKDNSRFAHFVYSRYQMFYIDEFQDTSEIQYEILKYYFGLPAKVKSGELPLKDVLVVGDDDQCIYSWRGSDKDIIKSRYLSDYQPNIFYMTRNYRCSSNILNFCKPSILQNTQRFDKQLDAKDFEGEKVQILTSIPVKNWRSFITKLTEQGTLGLLVRTNQDLITPILLMELCCPQSDYALSANFELSDNMFSAFKVFYFWSDEPQDMLKLEDILKVFLGLNAANLKMFLEMLVRYNMTFKSPADELIKVANECHLDDITTFIRHFSVILSKYTDDKVSGLTDVCALIKFLIAPKKKVKRTNQYIQIYHMFSVISTLIVHGVFYGFTKSAVLSFVELTLPGKVKAKKVTSEDSRLTVPISFTTVHDSKGKGWDSVVVYNDTADVFPYIQYSQKLSAAQYEEERCLHYIACTRAKKLLYILTASEESRQSPFLKECDFSYAEVKKSFSTDDNFLDS